jgi:glycerophosphoryl diester phosphodiesterase
MFKCIFFILIILCARVNSQPMIIAHRGAMGYAPENTLAAIKLGIELGAKSIEIDLRQTKDNIPVALHDATINNTTNGSGNIKNILFDDLKKLDAGSWFDSKFSSETVPSLQEIVDIIPDSVMLIIEFKEGNDTYPGIEENVISLIGVNKFESQTILKSFDPNVLERLRKLAPEIPLLYVYTFRLPWLGMNIDRGITFGSIFNIDAEYLQPHRFFLSESFVKEAQACGYKIVSWGVNSEEEIIESLDYGVDGIETDYPDRVLKLVNKKLMQDHLK